MYRVRACAIRMIGLIGQLPQKPLPWVSHACFMKIQQLQAAEHWNIPDTLDLSLPFVRFAFSVPHLLLILVQDIPICQLSVHHPEHHEA